MSLRLLEPGLCSQIVDAGRPRTRSLGVVAGGPADRSAFELGNALLGNEPDAAALEITLTGPVIQADASVGAVLIGAPFSISSARQRLEINQSFTLEEGDELHIGGARHGVRAYLCVVGGIQSSLILDSRMSFEPLKRGELLPCVTSKCRRRIIANAFELSDAPTLSPQLKETNRVLRVLPGPEADWFPRRGRELSEGPPIPTFSVLPESNRQGLRLSGEPLPIPPREMVSQPMVPGTLQLTRGGQLILLGVDGQSIGGYPRVGCVISADLDLVGQLRPGDSISFQPVTLDEAEQLGRKKRTLLDDWGLRLRQAAVAF